MAMSGYSPLPTIMHLNHLWKDLADNLSLASLTIEESKGEKAYYRAAFSCKMVKIKSYENFRWKKSRDVLAGKIQKELKRLKAKPKLVVIQVGNDEHPRST